MSCFVEVVSIVNKVNIQAPKVQNMRRTIDFHTKRHDIQYKSSYRQVKSKLTHEIGPNS